jgi:hypothetical protein
MVTLMLVRYRLILVLLLMACRSASALALEPERSGQASFVTRAVVAHGLMWILSDAGDLSTVKVGSHLMELQGVERPVLDVCVMSGNPQIVTTERGNKSWTIRHFANNKWLVDASVPTHGDQFIALNCSANGLTMLTSRRLIALNPGARRVVNLNKELVGEAVSSTFGTPNDVYVGINAGEWGGGLRRIDRQTGAVNVIARNSSGALCDGPLNTKCDPVTGIASDPWNAGCVVIAIGLEHFISHGRIDEVCGNSVRSVYYKKHVATIRPDCKQPSGEPCETVAFFGVVRQGNEILAVGNGGLYRIQRVGSANYSRLPKFVAAGQIYLSYDIPGLILVLTDVNERRSMSGSVPLLVTRDEAEMKSDAGGNIVYLGDLDLWLRLGAFFFLAAIAGALLSKFVPGWAIITGPGRIVIQWLAVVLGLATIVLCVWVLLTLAAMG